MCQIDFSDLSKLSIKTVPTASTLYDWRGYVSVERNVEAMNDTSIRMIVYLSRSLLF